MTRALLAKVHIAKKQLGLDDDLYRATLEEVTGKTSSKDCSEAELEAVLKRFSKAGFKPKGKVFTGPATKLAAKIHALWISGWNLGVIRDNSDAAMEAFIARQTGVAKAQWLKDPRDAAKVIDALKAWLAREGGVRWTSHRDPQDAVAAAQHRVLTALVGSYQIPNTLTAIGRQGAMGKLIRQASAQGQF